MDRERGFRRLFHTFGTVFLAYYLIPVEPPELRLVAEVGGIAALTVALGVEAFRLRGWLGRRQLYGLREYERYRPASYLYWGIGALPLFLLAPEQIAVPCVLCAALGDPLVGEMRLQVGPYAGAAAGFAAATVFFAIVQIPLWIAPLGGVAFVAAESFKNPWLDDDLLTLVVPALLLVGLWAAGLYAPVDVIAPMPDTMWL